MTRPLPILNDGHEGVGGREGVVALTDICIYRCRLRRRQHRRTDPPLNATNIEPSSFHADYQRRWSFSSPIVAVVWRESMRSTWRTSAYIPQCIVVVADVPRNDFYGFSRSRCRFEMNEIIRTSTGIGLTWAIVQQSTDRTWHYERTMWKKPFFSMLFLVSTVQFGPLNFEDAEPIEISVDICFGGKTWHTSDKHFLRE